jgi:nucleotide-binding universal stress UspA family protein
MTVSLGSSKTGGGGNKIRQNAKQGIEEIEALCNDSNVAFKFIESDADPVDALIDAWRYADLVMLGLHSWFKRDVIEKPSDVLLKILMKGVRPIIAFPEEIYEVKKVLIAYSGSPESAFAMKRFVHLNMWEDMDLHIATFGKSAILAEQLLNEAEDYCRDHGFDPKLEAVDGDPSEAVDAYADKIGADLIALGSGYNSALFKSSFSSVTIQLIKNSARPLFMSH